MIEFLTAALLSACCSGTGSISGLVRDADTLPVENATVCVLDAHTGIPIRRATSKPFTHEANDVEDAMADIVFAQTNEAGQFTIAGIAPGDYRLIAQSWIGADEITGVLEINSKAVHIRGTADVSLDPDEHAAVTIDPIGNATLILGDHAGNSETLVVISTKPTQADPILGFAGWAGPFLQQSIGFNRMPDGVTTFHGLPDGDVHVAVFAPDNIPGCGAATIACSSEKPMWVKMPFIVTWSDGVHSPPPDLAALTDQLARLPIAEQQELQNTLMDRLRDDDDQEARPGMMTLFARASRILEVDVTLPDGTVHPGADVMAALGYAAMRRSFEANGRTPNPYRAPEVRPATAAEIRRSSNK